MTISFNPVCPKCNLGVMRRRKMPQSQGHYLQCDFCSRTATIKNEGKGRGANRKTQRKNPMAQTTNKPNTPRWQNAYEGQSIRDCQAAVANDDERGKAN